MFFFFTKRFFKEFHFLGKIPSFHNTSHILDISNLWYKAGHYTGKYHVKQTKQLYLIFLFIQMLSRKRSAVMTGEKCNVKVCRFRITLLTAQTQRSGSLWADITMCTVALGFTSTWPPWAQVKATLHRWGDNNTPEHLGLLLSLTQEYNAHTHTIC